ncbi:MAG: DNA polymerase III subunit delta' [Deltaproteobacteria bacterium]
MNFNDFVGQEKIKSTLKDIIQSGKLSHAYMFEGADGMGKSTLARIFAQAALCRNFEKAPCGECSSCTKLSNSNHPDFYTISPKGLSIGVDEVRKLQENIIIKPIESEKKVYIIEQADKMTEQAQNCLLKTLEEPPGDSLLILCVQSTANMLKTIKSRCVSLKFDIYKDEEIKAVLRMHDIDNEESLELASVFSQGILSKAFLVVSEEFMRVREEIICFLSNLHGSRIEDLLKTASYLDSKKEFIQHIFDIISSWYRDLAVYKVCGNDRLLINLDKKDIILKNIKNYSERDIVQIIKKVEESRRDIRRNVNLPIVIDNMLIGFWEVVNDKSCRSAV